VIVSILVPFPQVGSSAMTLTRADLEEITPARYATQTSHRGLPQLADAAPMHA
jgi:hypothetical protein